MTVGIYELIFENTNLKYIGKSINIENRWKQHAEAFRKGKAAALMQQEFNNYGFPDGSIIFECHEDHLDIGEETLIFREHPELNGTKGRDRLTVPPEKATYIRGVSMNDLFQLSTLDHISEIIRLRSLLGM